LDRDPALAFEVHRVEDLVAELALLHRATALDQAVCQRRLAVVDVGDDAEVADVVHGLRAESILFGARHGASARSARVTPNEREACCDLTHVSAGAHAAFGERGVASRQRILEAKMKYRTSVLGTACALSVVAAAASAGQIPITTSSAEAKQLYLKGRDLQEKLRATDARPLFEQALAKDPAFTLAAVGLANSSGTAKEFFDGVSRAVSLSAKASEPEKLVVCALDAGAKDEPARQKECLTKLTTACPDDARAQNLMGAFHFGRQDYD